MDKIDRLRLLAIERKADERPGYFRLSDFHEGAYDRHDHVSPWSLSAHNADAQLLILLQDWSSSDVLSRDIDREAVEKGYTPSLRTNVNLIDLVRQHFGLNISETYVTNLFVFIKPGGISARIPMSDMEYCAERYAIPQIRIVCPPVALCVGLQTLNAVRLALGESPVRAAAAANEPLQVGSTLVFGVPHTGWWGTINAGGRREVDAIWRGIATRPVSPPARSVFRHCSRSPCPPRLLVP